MYNKQISLRLDEKLHKALKKEASKQMRTINSQVRVILTRYLKEKNETS